MDSNFDALVAARQRIKELEDMVAVLTEKIQMMDSALSLVSSSAIKQNCIQPAVLPHARDSGLTALECIEAGSVSTQSAPQYSPENFPDRTSGHQVHTPHEMERDVLDQKGEDPVYPAAKNTPCDQEQSTKKGKKGTRANITNPVTRHVALKIMYWGSRFQGFAFQPGSQVTVESELFAALRRTKLLIDDLIEAKYSRCGRTDKGVSAIGQVVALKLRTSCKSLVDKVGFPSQTEDNLRDGDREVLSTIVQVNGGDEEISGDRVAAARASRGAEESVSSNFGDDDGEIDYVGVLNRVLPDDIRVVGWCPVPIGFHARFSCLYREYKYFFVGGNLDIYSMKLAASKFLGEHDFRNFCKMDAANVHNYRRTVTELELVPFNGRWNCPFYYSIVRSAQGRNLWLGKQVWVMRVKGTAFLWHQIRCMAAVLFMVGQGYESATIVGDLLVHASNTTRKPQYTMAPEKPLVLCRCGFQGLNFHCTQRAMKQLQEHLQRYLDQALLDVSLIQEALQELPVSGTSDTEHRNKLKRMHIPLSRRQTEPSYEDRKTRSHA